jgi:hypothetical protein
MPKEFRLDSSLLFTAIAYGAHLGAGMFGVKERNPITQNRTL